MQDGLAFSAAPAGKSLLPYAAALCEKASNLYVQMQSGWTQQAQDWVISAIRGIRQETR